VSDNLFREEAINNHRERLWGNVILIQPFTFKLLTMVIASMIAMAIYFLFSNSYIKRESVVGYLVPDKGVAKVYAPTFGNIDEATIREGDLVSKGDVLLNIATRRSTVEIEDLSTSIAEQIELEKSSLERKVKREREFSRSESSRLEGRINDLKKEKLQISQQIESLEKRINIAQEKLETNRDLAEQGFIAKTALIDAEDRYLDIKAGISSATRILESINAQISDTKRQKAQLPIQMDSKLTDFERQQNGLNNRLLENVSQKSYAIRAPIDGKISFMQVKNGQSVSMNAPILTILPEDTMLYADLFVPTRAVGFIEKGQKVLLRYSAFPYQRFGLHDGEITDISKVILAPNEVPVPVPLAEPVYRVTVALDKQSIQAKGQNIPLQTGMMLEADILVDERSLAEWLLEPIYSLKGRI